MVPPLPFCKHLVLQVPQGSAKLDGSAFQPFRELSASSVMVRFFASSSDCLLMYSWSCSRLMVPAMLLSYTIPRLKLVSLARSRMTAFVCSCETLLSVTSSTSPISLRVRSS